MSDEIYVIDVDDQSDEGEIKTSPRKRYRSSGSTIMTDSLEIKPPQVAARHHKISSHRKEKYSSDRREVKEYKMRQHHEDGKHRDKSRDIKHRRYEVESSEKPKKSDSSSKREKESRHERKDVRTSSTGERLMEDLRERLIDKRRERREEPLAPREYATVRNERTTREVRPDELRERRELRIAAAVAAAAAAVEEVQEPSRSSKHKRLSDQNVSSITHEVLVQHRSSKEKKHKKSRKHDKLNERDKDMEIAHRERRARHQQQQPIDINVYEELERMEAIAAEQHMVLTKETRQTDHEIRRQRLLIAEREINFQKESARLERDARRLKKLEKSVPVVQISDESVHNSESSSDSSNSSSDEEEDDEETESNHSDYNDPSPPHRNRHNRNENEDHSRYYADTNGTRHTDYVEIKNEAEAELPPYFPAVQGCRSVEEYRCLNKIAEGTYGVVYRAEDRRTKEIVALKRLKMEKEKEGFPITSLREINTLLKAQHPNIVTVREIVVGSNMDKIFIVMDYVEHDLKSLMETMKSKNHCFSSGEIKCLMQQILRAVAHLHDNWILHRDLKTSNLLLSHKGILKVGDFGLAREYGSPLKYYTSMVVTLWYRAPELLLGSKQYSTPIDMWSVGCIFAELVKMEAYFPGKSDIDLINMIYRELGTPTDKIWPGYSKLPLVKKINFAQHPVNNIKSRFRLQLSDLGMELLNKLLTYDPMKRITAEAALEHGYFKESPQPIDPALFPTYPAKSEFGIRTVNASPQAPSGGREFKFLSDIMDEEDNDDNGGFHMGPREAISQPSFQIKF
ncbi:cyclin-dependent kinase 11B-like isoform X2 [Phymastichus coffea]|uniref:cyclin-dependent kinase 11B-like isoform X2 n=1 Tax=Phymastichus coffea TaxID=108790 RepID=UPI00273BEF4C|nr:cyclin-dependent kinase 11B-like isoform X2 [Phymastichus coffea]